MKKNLIYLLLLFSPVLHFQQSFSQPANTPGKEVFAKERIDSLALIQEANQQQIIGELKFIRTQVDTILRTEPETLGEAWLKNAFMQKTYEWVFGSGGGRGMIPFLLSVIGLCVSIIKLVISIKNKEKLKNILIYVLLLIISFLLFVISNNKKGAYADISTLDAKIEQMSRKLDIAQDKLSKADTGRIVVASSDNQAIQDEIRLIRNDMVKSEGTIVKKIDDSSTGFWFKFFVFGALLVIIFITVSKKE